jgi:hypothetical protein
VLRFRDVQIAEAQLTVSGTSNGNKSDNSSSDN